MSSFIVVLIIGGSVGLLVGWIVGIFSEHWAFAASKYAKMEKEFQEKGRGEVTTYYHGGPPNLSVILPPSITGACSLSDYDNGLCKRDRVYITTSYEAALMYAAGHPSGVVYVVDPVYPLESDADCDTPGLSYACRKARILSHVPISGSTRKAILAMLVNA